MEKPADPICNSKTNSDNAAPVLSKMTDPMMEVMPSIAVAVICYNQAHTLTRCLQSLSMQKYPRLELIVVDDYSCDWNTAEVSDQAERLLPGSRIVVHQMERHSGPQPAYQWALEAAQSEHILFLGGDDWLADSHVLVGIGGFISRSAQPPCVIQARAKLIGKNSRLLPAPKKDYPPMPEGSQILYNAAINTGSPFSLHSAVFQTKRLLAEGGFSGEYCFALENPLFCKLVENGIEITPLDMIITYEQDGGAYRMESLNNVYLREGLVKDQAHLVETLIIPHLEKEGWVREKQKCQQKIEQLDVDAEVKRWWFTFSHIERLLWKLKNADRIVDDDEGNTSGTMIRLIISTFWVLLACMAIKVVFPEGIILNQGEFIIIITVMLAICLGCAAYSMLQLLFKRPVLYTAQLSTPFFVLLLCVKGYSCAPLVITARMVGVLFWIVIALILLEIFLKSLKHLR